MRLGKYLSSRTRPELEDIKYLLNLTDDEELVFDQISKGRSIIAVAANCAMSMSAVDDRIKEIRQKLLRIGGDYNE